MVYPLTHIVLAQKVFKEYFPGQNYKDFIVGTSLPDIRYLGVIDRKNTHFNEVVISDIQKENSFMAGFKFHSLIDRVREEYITEQGYYDISPESENKWLVHSALKFYEDIILYSKVTNWSEISEYFDKVLDSELFLDVEKKDILKWHGIIKNYIQNSPDPKKMLIGFGNNADQSDGRISDLLNYLSELEKNPRIVEIVEGLYKNIENLLDQ